MALVLFSAYLTNNNKRAFFTNDGKYFNSYNSGKKIHFSLEEIREKHHIYLDTTKILRLLVCDNLFTGTETFMSRSALNKAGLLASSIINAN